MKKMYWKIHTSNLLKELTDCGLDSRMGVYRIPLNQLRILLIEISERAIQLDDPILNALMCRLTLYEQSDPESKEYNSKKINKVINDGMKLKEDKT